MDISEKLRESLGDRYEVEHELGRGGMAIVFLAHDRKLDRSVAIKVLRPELSASLGAERFLREIQIAARLQHPHVLPLYESGQADGLLYYVMPYVEGESLRDRLEREKQLPLEDAVQISRDVSEALGYAHSHGVVHRDIKPENILLSGDQAIVADFGIARAVSQAGGTALTDSGLAIGTPPYMSPEQAAGSVDLDSRSDIYSLGCVLYEMLAGETPFTGPTPQAVVAKQISETPPRLHIVRPSVPPAVEHAIEKSLEKVPADRFTSAHQFSQALTRLSAAARVRRVKRWVWATVTSAAAVVVAALVALLVWPGVFRGESLRPGHYVVGAVRESSGTVTPSESMAVNVALQSAVRRVPGITLEESTRVIDRLSRAGGAETVADWLAIARALGAGRAIVYALIPLDDSTEVITWVYDVRTGRMVDRATGWVGAGSAVAESVARLVERLFDLGGGSITVRGSASDEADLAYVEGRQALRFWDLRAAEEGFRRAVEEDPNFAEAQLELARVKWWARDAADQWIMAARRAAQLRDSLEPPHNELALGLLSLAQDQFPQACEHFEAIVAADSNNFSGWLGLGDCQWLDKIVVRDESSPSQWRYRSGHHGALNAYQQAIEVVPSYTFAIAGKAFAGVADVLAYYAQPNYLRSGYALPPDTGLFASWAEFVGDTLAFVPHPALDLMNSAPGTKSATQNEAVDWVRGRLRVVVRDWADAFPDSSAPLRAMARSLELDGALEGRGERRSALAAAREARRLARSADDSLAADVIEVRLLVKAQHFEDAHQVARNALQLAREPTMERAQELAGIAELLGMPNRAAELAAAAAPVVQADTMEGFGGIALPIVEARQRLIAYASLGAPRDSIGAAASRLEELTSIHAMPGEAERTICRVLWYPLSVGFPVLQRASSDERCLQLSYMQRLQSAFVAGDTLGVRAQILRLDSLRVDQRPGDASIDGIYVEAWILLQVGDTVAAVRRLDRTLGALRGLGTDLVTQMPQAGCIVRAMALRAELAAAVGDDATARRWAAPVVVLWGGVEVEELREVVVRARAIADS
jgi:tetratricopeptide (TPR) repeat protein